VTLEARLGESEKKVKISEASIENLKKDVVAEMLKADERNAEQHQLFKKADAETDKRHATFAASASQTAIVHDNQLKLLMDNHEAQFQRDTAERRDQHWKYESTLSAAQTAHNEAVMANKKIEELYAQCVAERNKHTAKHDLGYRQM
jgi:hypothetical protein